MRHQVTHWKERFFAAEISDLNVSLVVEKRFTIASIILNFSCL